MIVYMYCCSDKGFPYDDKMIVFERGQAIVQTTLLVGVYNTDDKSSYTLKIRQGFICDGVSTPLGMLKATAKLAGVVHDAITRRYEHRFTILEAHSIFRQIILNKQATYITWEWTRGIKAWAMWLAVFCFGWIFWKKRR